MIRFRDCKGFASKCEWLIWWFRGLLCAAVLAGCATKTAALDGTGIQANQYSGLTVFSGSLLSIAQGMEFCETYEDVSTSWWNFGRYNYRRRTTWASSSTNQPPSSIASEFAPNVNSSDLFTTVTTNSGSVATILTSSVSN